MKPRSCVGYGVVVQRNVFQPYFQDTTYVLLLGIFKQSSFLNEPYFFYCMKTNLIVDSAVAEKDTSNNKNEEEEISNEEKEEVNILQNYDNIKFKFSYLESIIYNKISSFGPDRFNHTALYAPYFEVF